jgi:hypothetical protein
VRLRAGVPVVLQPEVLLHKEATSMDIFRAMIVVNRLSYNFGKASEPISVSSAAAPLQKLPLGSKGGKKSGKMLQSFVSVSSTADTEQMDGMGIDDMGMDSMDSIGLGKDALFDMVRAAYAYEKEHLSSISDHLQAAGWIVDRFMFGNIKHRVEW